MKELEFNFQKGQTTRLSLDSRRVICRHLGNYLWTSYDNGGPYTLEKEELISQTDFKGLPYLGELC